MCIRDSVTLPSHTALLTGLHPRESEVVNNVTAIRREANTLAESFADAGYGTLGVISSRHLSDSISGFGQGFDRYFETGGWDESAEDSTKRLLAWIQAEQDRPLFAFLHLFDAHAPYQPPASFVKKEKFKNTAERQRHLYAAEVSYVDSQLARLLEHPRVQAGIVAFTADHGESLGAHNIFFAHAELYPSTMHVPLLMRWPGSPQGLSVPGEVRQQDIGRTLLDLSGFGDKPFPGNSLLEYLHSHSDGEPLPNRPTYALAAGSQSAAIRHQGWMLVLHLEAHRPAKNPKAEEYGYHQVTLFHLENDPQALEDLSKSKPERAHKLRAALITWLRKPRDTGISKGADLGESDLQALKQLGYVGGALDGALDPDTLFPEDCDCEACALWHD